GNVGGDDVGSVPVERDAGPVISHGGPRVRVARGLLDISQRHSGVEPGRERFANPAEYLRRPSGEMGLLVLVDALLPLRQLHRAVTRRYGSRCLVVASVATRSSRGRLTCNFSPGPAYGLARPPLWIPYGAVITHSGECCTRCNSAHLRGGDECVAQ